MNNDFLLRDFDMALNESDMLKMEQILAQRVYFNNYDFSKILMNRAGITKESTVIKIIDLLILYGVYIMDNSTHQLFYGMIRHNYLEGIKFLLQLNQVKFDTIRSGMVGSVAFGSIEMIQLFLNFGADINTSDIYVDPYDLKQYTMSDSLKLLIENNQIKKINFLIESNIVDRSLINQV